MIRLRELIQSSRIDVQSFFTIALGITRLLDGKHREGVSVPLLNPACIMLNLQTCEPLILVAEHADRADPDPVGFAYYAPEQFGRMNRPYDRRSDLYKLGVIFYEMIAGRLPIQAEDPIGWAHAHMAIAPKRLHDIRSDIPIMVGNIVMKLLAKTVDERYQSAYGLAQDLYRCQDEWKRHGCVGIFELGAIDAKSQFRFPGRLYGRDHQIELLKAAVDRASSGGMELVLIEGCSGSGKTALARLAHTMLKRKISYYAEGKFDQQGKDIPYSPLVQMFRGLICQLLTENEDQVAWWRKKFLDDLGAYGSVIANILPEIELILGKQPSARKLPPTDADKRFQAAFLKLIHVFTQSRRPVVLFIDDLQWADPASLCLLQTLLAEPCPFFMVMAAYRDDLTDPEHPHFGLFDKLRQTAPKACLIRAKEWDYPEVVSVLADTLHKSVEFVGPLAEALYQKTAGNPLYISQWMDSIYKDRQLYFDLEQGEWRWKLDEIKGREGFGNVIRIIAGRFGKLPHSTQAVLRIAACIGNTFDFRLLTWVSGSDERQILSALSPALTEGLIVQAQNAGDERDAGEAFVFLHDQVQQAIYEQIAAEEKIACHLHIGRMMRQRLHADDQDLHIFELTHHLNTGSSLITDQAERRQLAELNLKAGKLAKSNAAFTTALGLLKAGLAYATEETEKTDETDDLIRRIWLERSECEYMCGDFAQARQIAERLLKQAQTPLERTPVYLVLINMYTCQNAFEQVKQITLRAIDDLGFHFPAEVTPLRFMTELLRTFQFLRERLDRLNTLPELADSRLIALSEVIMASASPLSIAYPDFMHALFLRYIRRVVRFGCSEAVAFILISSATTIFFVFKGYRFAFQLADISLLLARRYKSPMLEGKIQFNIGLMMQYKDHVASNRSMELSLKLSSESGDRIYADYAMGGHAVNTFGRLEQTEMLLERYLDMMKTFFQPVSRRTIQIGLQYVRALKGQTDDWRTLGMKVEPDHRLKSFNDQLYYYFYSCLIELHYLFGDYQGLLALAEQSKAWKLNYLPIHRQQIQYYRFLAIAALYRHSSPWERSKKRLLMKNLLRKMKQWTVHAPQSSMHKYLLMSAEWAQIKGSDLSAMRLYDEAVLSAKEAGYMQHEAIACQLAAEYYAAKGIHNMSEQYLQRACNIFAEWGASRKVSQLLKRYPGLKSEQDGLAEDGKAAVAEPPRPSGNLVHRMDMDALRQAAAVQTIEEFLDLAMAHFGAERGAVLQKHSGELVFAARRMVNKRRSLPNNESISLRIVQYVMRTQESVVLDEAGQSRFASDPYIVREQPKSIMCLPLQISDQANGVIYLENNLATHAFSADRTDILTMLASQAYKVIRLLNSYNQEPSEAGGADKRELAALADPLTVRELEVLNLMAAGLANQEIAERLGVTVGTVKNHAKSIFSKLHVNKRMKAVAQAKELKLLNEENRII